MFRLRITKKDPIWTRKDPHGGRGPSTKVPRAIGSKGGYRKDAGSVVQRIRNNMPKLINTDTRRRPKRAAAQINYAEDNSEDVSSADGSSCDDESAASEETTNNSSKESSDGHGGGRGRGGRGRGGRGRGGRSGGRGGGRSGGRGGGRSGGRGGQWRRGGPNGSQGEMNQNTGGDRRGARIGINSGPSYLSEGTTEASAADEQSPSSHSDEYTDNGPSVPVRSEREGSSIEINNEPSTSTNDEPSDDEDSYSDSSSVSTVEDPVVVEDACESEEGGEDDEQEEEREQEEEETDEDDLEKILLDKKHWRGLEYDDELKKFLVDSRDANNADVEKDMPAADGWKKMHPSEMTRVRVTFDGARECMIGVLNAEYNRLEKRLDALKVEKTSDGLLKYLFGESSRFADAVTRNLELSKDQFNEFLATFYCAAEWGYRQSVWRRMRGSTIRGS